METCVLLNDSHYYGYSTCWTKIIWKEYTHRLSSSWFRPAFSHSRRRRYQWEITEKTPFQWILQRVNMCLMGTLFGVFLKYLLIERYEWRWQATERGGGGRENVSIVSAPLRTKRFRMCFIESKQTTTIGPDFCSKYIRAWTFAAMIA